MIVASLSQPIHIANVFLYKGNADSKVFSIVTTVIINTTDDIWL